MLILNSLAAVTLAMPATYAALFTALLFIVYGVFGLLEKRPRPVNFILAGLALVAGVLIFFGK